MQEKNGNVILIPGVGCNEKVWQPIIDVFPKDFNVKVADITQGKTVPEIADIIISTLPEKFSLVGFSMGSWIAMQIAQSLGSRVNKCVFMGSTPGLISKEKIQLFRQIVSLIEEGEFSQIINSICDKRLHPTSAADNLKRKYIIKMMNEVGVDLTLQQFNAAIDTINLHFDFQKLTCKSYIIRGDVDLFSKQDLIDHYAILKKFPKPIKEYVVKNCGHFIAVEQPAQCKAILKEVFYKNEE